MKILLATSAALMLMLGTASAQTRPVQPGAYGWVPAPTVSAQPRASQPKVSYGVGYPSRGSATGGPAGGYPSRN